MTALARAFSKLVVADELPALVSTFRQEGYEGLQLKGAQYLPYLGEPARALDELGADPGVYSAIIAGAGLDEDGLQSIESTIDFAVAVGAERIVFCHAHPHDGVDAAMRRDFARILTDVAKSAGDRGVRFSLHHHFDQPVMVLEDFREFFDGLEPGVLGLTADTAHLAKSGVTDLPAFFTEFGSFVDNVHLKDFDGEWRLVGEGNLDLDGGLRALELTGYEGWLCIDEETQTSLADGFRISRAWLEERGR